MQKPFILLAVFSLLAAPVSALLCDGCLALVCVASGATASHGEHLAAPPHDFSSGASAAHCDSGSPENGTRVQEQSREARRAQSAAEVSQSSAVLLDSGCCSAMDSTQPLGMTEGLKPASTRAAGTSAEADALTLRSATIPASLFEVPGATSDRGVAAGELRPSSIRLLTQSLLL